MPHFYLHFRDGDGLEEDFIGRALPDLDAAHAEALRVARDLQAIWSDLPAEARSSLAFEIVDETGKTVRVVPFSEAAGRTH
jgi:hypothetical protein